MKNASLELDTNATATISTRPIPPLDAARSIADENRSAGCAMPHASDLPYDFCPDRIARLSPAFMRLVTRLR